MEELYCEKFLRDAILIVAAISLKFIKEDLGINQPPPPICAEQHIEEWNERHSMFQQGPQEPVEFTDSFLERLDPRYRRMWEAQYERRSNSNRVDEQRASLEPEASMSDSRAIPDTTSCGLVFYIDSH